MHCTLPGTDKHGERLHDAADDGGRQLLRAAHEPYKRGTLPEGSGEQSRLWSRSNR